MSNGPSACRAAIGAILAFAAAGCGSEAETPVPAVPVCDGSDRLTLRIYFAGGGLDTPGGEVRKEHGYTSVAVDGKCQYFVSGGWNNQAQGRDLGWRRGTLDDEERRTLERGAGAEDLTSVYGCAAGLFDAPDMIVANTRSTLSCPGGREDLLAFFARLGPLARGLWERGLALDGDLHITLRSLASSTSPAYAWPGELPLRGYFDADPQSSPPREEEQRRRIVAEAAAPLRELRERYLRDTRGPLFSSDGILVTEADTAALLFMRDALPYEDEAGRWPLSAE